MQCFFADVIFFKALYCISESRMKPAVRRCSDSLQCQHLWDAITTIRNHKQLPSFDRIRRYMNRMHNMESGLYRYWFCSRCCTFLQEARKYLVVRTSLCGFRTFNLSHLYYGNTCFVFMADTRLKMSLVAYIMALLYRLQHCIGLFIYLICWTLKNYNNYHISCFN